MTDSIVFNDKSPIGTVELEKKMKFGTEFLYPVNIEAKIICELLNQTTITRRNCKDIVDLGFRIVIKGEATEVLS